MGRLIYNIFLAVYGLGFRLAALFNNKASLGLKGRRKLFSRMEAEIKDRKGQTAWMHCASLGEFEQGRPLLESIKKNYPDLTIILTFFSASGYEAMKGYTLADHIFYLPLDGIANARKLLDIFQPTLVLWVKYEYWFYYLREIKSRNVPLLLVSGIFRQGQPFFSWYGWLWRQMLGFFTIFFVQNESSEELLATVGINANVEVTGDTRFDRVLEIAEHFEGLPLIEKFCGDSRVIVAGSTWEDDEAELIHYVKANPAVRFIIAPHEIDADNLDDVRKEFPGSIFYSEMAAESMAAEPTLAYPQVLIIDNVGMLSRLYHYADIAYVGGGFGADGVHNVLEAAVYGKPVIHGPEYEKYAEALALVETGAGIPVQNALELEKVLNELWANKALLAEKSRAAKAYVESQGGASRRIVRYIQEKRLLTN